MGTDKEWVFKEVSGLSTEGDLVVVSEESGLLEKENMLRSTQCDFRYLPEF